MASTIGIPIKVLHEAEGHIVTIETMLGEVYRGKLVEAEDNMNVQMEACTVTYRNGQTSKMENVFIRGSKIRFIILPDMLKNAPMFRNMTSRGGRGGRGGGGGFSGKDSILKSQAARGRGRGGRGGGRGFGGRY